MSRIDIPTPVLIVAALSDIGRALAREYGAAGCSLILAARRPDELEADKADLQIRYGFPVDIAACDVTDHDPSRFFAALPTTPGTVVMVAGLLGEHAEAESVASAVFSLLSCICAVLVLVGVTLTPLLIDLIAPGFHGSDRELTIRLVRILFPATGMLVLGAWCLGVLNSHRKFLLSYSAPIAEIPVTEGSGVNPSGETN